MCGGCRAGCFALCGVLLSALPRCGVDMAVELGRSLSFGILCVALLESLVALSLWCVHGCEAGGAHAASLASCVWRSAAANCGRRSKILHQVSSARPAALYADGARAWGRAAKWLGLRCYHCVHQKKQYAVKIKGQPVPRGLSRDAGTQCLDDLDADWRSLKAFVPKETARKQGHGDCATHAATLERRVWQWFWRRAHMRGDSSSKMQGFSRMWRRK